VLIPLPDDISDRTASTLMMKGLTAQYLFRQVYPLRGGETILYHAAAGGVGLIACQWARALGVHMIGTVSTDEKAAIAKANGCEHVIVTSRENIVERVRKITGGKGLKVVYDSVGKDTWDKSLDCLRPFGLMACFGASSGPVAPFAPAMLASKGSLYVTRATLFTHIATREATQAMADELFGVVVSGKVTFSALGPPSTFTGTVRVSGSAVPRCRRTR